MLSLSELRQLQSLDLKAELEKSAKELLKVAVAVRNKSSKETHMIGVLKRYIARIRTIEKESTSKSESKMTVAKKTPKKMTASKA